LSILLDSDIVIEILRSRDQLVLSQWKTLASAGTLVLFSAVSAAEIWAGVRPNERGATSLFFNHLTCIPVDYKIGELAGDFLRQFRKSHNVTLGDALIAATAIVSQAALWTRNRKHYPMPEVTFHG
jgi:predicted nucleic acid-binding protein